MCTTYQSRNKTDKDFLNSLINRLLFEIHVSRYNYCGPSTKLEERLWLDQQGINTLDKAFKNHDIMCFNTKDLDTRHKADKVLENRAMERVKAGDSSEETVAYGVVNVMKAKQKLWYKYKKILQ